MKAQERWVEKGISSDDFFAAAGAECPFDRSIGKVGIPHGSIHFKDVPGEIAFRECLAILLRMPSGRHRMHLGQAILSDALQIAESQGFRRPLMDASVLYELIGYSAEQHYFIADYLLIGEEFNLACDALRASMKTVCCSRTLYFYDILHGVQLPQRYESMMKSMLRHLSVHKDDTWLLYPIALLAAAGQEIDAALNPEVTGLTPREQASAIILKVLQETFCDEDGIALKSEAVRAQFKLLAPFGSLIRGIVSRSPRVGEKFLHALRAELEPSEVELRRAIVVGLNEVVNRRKSGLLSSEAWESLGLPKGLREVAISARAVHS